MPRRFGFNRLSATLTLFLLSGGELVAQSADAGKGSLVRLQVHGHGLEGALAGDSANREVSTYLPPSYGGDRNRRYPVLYMLHGFTDNDSQWMGVREHWINLTELLDKTIADGGSKEMIVVMPNAYTRFHGSMYSSSPTTGDWESYIARELPAFIDANYRTIARRESRGLAGHSMGGYGAMRIGMKNPDVFSSVYLLSPCCMGPRGRRRGGDGPSPAAGIDSFEKLSEASFGVKAMFASAAAWAPNPKKPPFYLDLPFDEKGEPRPEIAAKMAANAPLAMVEQYLFNIKRLKALAFDSGDQDRGIAATVNTLDQILNDYKIEHTFEIYQGDHVNRIAERIETKTLPFFSVHLAFE